MQVYNVGGNVTALRIFFCGYEDRWYLGGGLGGGYIDIWIETGTGLRGCLRDMVRCRYILTEAVLCGSMYWKRFEEKKN